ncbi:MAG TPA: hypothetical protein VOA87_01460 [Thermoanaerobaculia bacterium]|nr:hypothetical protein [Thermoanaerobaculia bacterium]
MKRRALQLFAAAALLALPAAAQSADDVIAKVLQAQGGLDRLKAVQTQRVTGHLSFGPDAAGLFSLELKRPGKMHMEMTLQGMTLVRIYDGQKGWQVNPFAGKAEPEEMSADDLRNIAAEADFDGPFVDYKQKGNKVELAGKEKVGGRDAYRLKVTFPNGDVQSFFFDANTYLKVEWQGTRKINGKDTVFESFFSDFREVGGLKMPYVIESENADNPQKQTMTLDKVEINVKEDDSRFAPPAKAKVN